MLERSHGSAIDQLNPTYKIIIIVLGILFLLYLLGYGAGYFVGTVAKYFN